MLDSKGANGEFAYGRYCYVVKERLDLFHTPFNISNDDGDDQGDGAVAV
jgi:hypothetical protein